MAIHERPPTDDRSDVAHSSGSLTRASHLELRSARIGATAVGALAIGAVAIGALAIGALAIGALAIGRTAIGRVRIGQLEVDEVVVRRLRITEELHIPGESRDGR